MGALALGLLYAVALCYRGKGMIGLLVKTGSTALIAWGLVSGQAA